MKNGCFITGTDTGVGKTLFAAWLLCDLRRRNADAFPMKPVQTGCERRGDRLMPPDPLLCLRLAGLVADESEMESICPYRMELPVSPHRAAQREGVTLSIDRMVESARRLWERHDILLIEGAGGVRVPINDRETMLDLMIALDLPVILVARPGLGTLNHTWLTVDALRAAGLSVTGVVLVHTRPDDPQDVTDDNARTLADRCRVAVWGRLSYDADIPSHRISGSRLLRLADDSVHRHASELFPT